MKNLIRFDWALKRLLRNKANFSILEGFLSELLKEDIQIRQLLESESNQEHSSAKFNRVDLLAENSRSELILIEVQNDREADYFHRMLFGTSKLVTEHMQMGDEYAKIKKIYSINIVYFDLGQGKDYIYHGITHFSGIHQHDTLALSTRQQALFQAETPAGIMPEYYVIKVNQFDDIAKDTLDEWVFYLKNNKIENNFRARGLKEVNHLLELDAMGGEERRRYDRYLDDLRHERSVIFTAKDEGLAEGLAEGEAIGLEKGRAEGEAIGLAKARLELARKMLRQGMSIELIVTVTELSEQEVQMLAAQVGT